MRIVRMRIPYREKWIVYLRLRLLLCLMMAQQITEPCILVYQKDIPARPRCSRARCAGEGISLQSEVKHIRIAVAHGSTLLRSLFLSL